MGPAAAAQQAWEAYVGHEHMGWGWVRTVLGGVSFYDYCQPGGGARLLRLNTVSLPASALTVMLIINAVTHAQS
jgi:hypothetical protein